MAADARRPVHAGRSATWWIHPLLVAAFPVLFLFGSNVNEQVSLAPLLRPLGVVLAVAAVGVGSSWLIGRLTGAGPARPALATSLLLLLGLSYGHAWNAIGGAVGEHAFLLAAWASVAVAGLAVVVRLRDRTARRFGAGLTVVAGILVAINVVPLSQFVGRDDLDAIPPPSPARPEPAIAPTRDVWFLVWDRYAGATGLERTYGFDNGDFLDALRQRGFLVAEAATANYLKTGLSLASALNMTELDPGLLADEASAPDDWTPIIRRLGSSHAVERFLQARGYEYLHVGSRLGDTAVNVAADETFVYTDTSEFEAAFIDTTILRALEDVLPRTVPRGSIAYVPEQTLAQLDRLHDLADRPGLQFVFAHLLLPHPPYVFNADGSRVTDRQRDARTVDEQYLEQLRFTNGAILDLIDRLNAVPDGERPIIVLAADEGPFPERYRRDEDGFAWLEARPDELLRKFSILAAVQLPETDAAAAEAAGFGDTITLVNLFRVVFNSAFGADLDLLPNRNWAFVDQRHLYEMVDVTDRVRAALGR